MLLYHDNTLVLSQQSLAQEGIIRPTVRKDGSITYPLWTKWVNNGAELVQRGGNGRVALIKFETIPYNYQQLIKNKFGDPQKAVATTFQSRCKPDATAIDFFSNYILPDGSNLGAKDNGKYLREYSANASVLNTLHDLYIQQANARKKLAKKFSKKQFFSTYSPLVNDAAELGHSLPTTPVTLERKFMQYVKGFTNATGIFKKGYEALISDKFCNDNSRKVSTDIEKLLMALYTMPNKPFAADVHTLYLSFVAGKIEVIDKSTGELFNPSDFIRNGKPLEISRSTVLNYLNNPDNRSTVDTRRNSSHSYNNMHRPHHHRSLPQFSFSKISMDDRDLPRKLQNGKRVKAYYAYDVASGCVVGRAYSRSKDEALFLDCIRDAFRLIEREQLGMPLEVEVENHLVNKFADDLAFLFSYVRFCNPGNSQEKRAEHLNKVKKYQTEKKSQTGIGRWWSRHEAYRIDNDKIDDQFVEKEYSYERLVADDIAACNEFNNQLHPLQKKYPGKTRWQVLLENINPNTTQPNKAIVYRSIGEHAKTTIRRNQYVTANNGKYIIPSPEVMAKLQPHNYEVDAYYLPDADGITTEVFLYQNNNFICRCEKIENYNEARAEWTDADNQAYTNQAKYVSQFDARKKQQKEELPKVIIQERKEYTEAPRIVHAPIIEEESIDDILSAFNPADYKAKAQNDL